MPSEESLRRLYEEAAQNNQDPDAPPKIPASNFGTPAGDPSPSPSVQSEPEIADKIPDIDTIKDKIKFYASKYNVPADLALAQAEQESNFNPKALSQAGAIGVMQLMPETAKSLGVDPHDWEGNIEGGMRLTGTLLKRYGGDKALALAAYNAGPKAVDKYGGVPPFAETGGYVTGIAGKIKKYFGEEASAKDVASKNVEKIPPVTDMFGGVTNKINEGYDVNDETLKYMESMGESGIDYAKYLVGKETGLSKVFGTFNVFADNLARGGQGVKQIIKDEMDRYNDEPVAAAVSGEFVKEAGDLSKQGLTVGQALKKSYNDTILTHYADDFDSFVKGFKKPPEHQVKFDDLLRQSMGNDTIDKVNNFLHKTFKYQDVGSYISNQMPLSDENKKLFSNIADNTALGTGVNLINKVGDWALSNAVVGADIAGEIATDPINLLPFGLTGELLKNTFTGTMKGALWSMAKVSPEFAKSVVSNIDKVGNALKTIRGTYDPAYAVDRFSTDFYKSQGLDPQEALQKGKAPAFLIREMHGEAIADNQDAMVQLKGDRQVQNRPSLVRKMFRSTLGKLADKSGFEPQNYFTKLLAGVNTDTVEMNRMLGDVMGEVGDITDSYQPSLLSSSAKKISGQFLKDSLNEEEMSQINVALTGHLENLGKSEIKVKEGQDINSAINDAYAKDLKDLTDKGIEDAKKTANIIAQNRYEARVEDLNARHSLIVSTQNGARKAFSDLQREAASSIKNAISHEKNWAEKEFSQRKASYIQQSKEEVLAHKNKLEYLNEDMSEAASEEVANSNRRISELKKTYMERLEGIRRDVDKERDFRINNRVSQIHQDTFESGSGIMMGIKPNAFWDARKEEVAAKLKSQRDAEAKYFEKQLNKIKFTQINQDYLEANQQFFQDIQEQVMEKHGLNEQSKDLLRKMREGLDSIGADMVERGRLSMLKANYWARIAKTPEGGLMIMNPEDFGKGLTFRGGLSGISARTQERVMSTYESWKAKIAERGGEAETDAYNVMARVDLQNRLDASHHAILNALPNELKVGKQGKAILDYIGYVYNSTGRMDNKFAAQFRNISSTLNFYNKMLLTLPYPSFWFKHVGGIPLLMAQHSGLAAMGNMMKNLPEYIRMRFGIEKQFLNALGEAKTGEEILDSFKEKGVAQTAMLRGDINQKMDTLLNRYSKSDPRYYFTAALHSSQHAQDFMRNWGAYSFWKEGKSLEDASRSAKDAFYDYSHLNLGDRTIGGLQAFYHFKRKNLVGALRGLIMDPKQWALMSNFSEAMSTGKKPSAEEMTYMNNTDRDKLHIFGDMYRGMQANYEMGFTPQEHLFSTLAPLFRKGQSLDDNFVSRWLGEEFAQGMNPVLSLAINELSGHSFYNTNGTNVDPGFRRLPRDFEDLTDKQIKVLNGVAKFLHLHEVKREEGSDYDNGELMPRHYIDVPTAMFNFVSSGPSARMVKESYNLIDSFMKDTGKPANEASLLHLIRTGHVNSTDAALHLIFGANMKGLSLDEESDKREYLNQKRMEDLASKEHMTWKRTGLKKEYR